MRRLAPPRIAVGADSRQIAPVGREWAVCLVEPGLVGIAVGAPDLEQEVVSRPLQAANNDGIVGPLLDDPPIAGRLAMLTASRHRGSILVDVIAFPGHAGRCWTLARWRSLARTSEMCR